MSADVDPEDQTEEPTEKRLHDATERGEVAFSREAPLFASLSATFLALIFVIPGRAGILLSALVGLIDDPAGWRIERGEDIVAIADAVVVAGARFLMPTVILLIAAGILASVAQSPPRIVPEQMTPIPPVSRSAAAFAGCWAPAAGPSFVKSLIKLRRGDRRRNDTLVGQKVVLLSAMDVDPGVLPQRVLDLCVKAVAAVLVATLAVAAADLAWSRILLAARSPHEQAGAQGGAPAGRGRPDGQGALTLASSRPLAQAYALAGPAGDDGRDQPHPLRGCDAIRSLPRAARRSWSPRLRISSRSRSVRLPKTTASR